MSNPLPPPATPALSTPPYAPAPPPPPAPPGAVAPSGGTSGLAIASLVLGILWLCGLGSLLAIVFGAVALGVTRGGRKTGKGFAIAGLVLGIIGLLAAVVIWLVAISTADDFVNGTSDEYDDVTITNCSRSADGYGVAQLEITNDSSKPSSYIVTVDFRPAGGRHDVTADFEAVDRLDPGRSTTVDVRSPDPVGGPVRCHLDYVNRFAFTFDGSS